jgi:outer membrane protein OmpA-like peptidoglycan-associated protein
MRTTLKQNHDLKIRAILTGMLVAGACVVTFPAVAQTIANADAIEQALSGSESTGLPSRAFAPQRRWTIPDSDTRVCDRKQLSILQGQYQAKLAETGFSLSRTLYPEAAPSIDLDVVFNVDKATLKPEGMVQLDNLGAALNRPSLSKSKIVLAGHTDAQGAANYNDALSCERALVVRNYLRDRHAINADRLTPMGFGFSLLKDKMDPRAEVNRRVEVRIQPEPK